MGGGGLLKACSSTMVAMHRPLNNATILLFLCLSGGGHIIIAVV